MHGGEGADEAIPDAQDENLEDEDMLAQWTWKNGEGIFFWLRCMHSRWHPSQLILGGKQLNLEKLRAIFLNFECFRHAVIWMIVPSSICRASNAQYQPTKKKRSRARKISKVPSLSLAPTLRIRLFEAWRLFWLCKFCRPERTDMRDWDSWEKLVFKRDGETLDKKTEDEQIWRRVVHCVWF